MMAAPKVAVAGATLDGNCVTRDASPVPLGQGMAPATIAMSRPPTSISVITMLLFIDSLMPRTFRQAT